MWNCQKCSESLEDTFAICWQCGTDCHGVQDPNFHLTQDRDQVTTDFGTAERHRGREYFSLASCIILSTWAAFAIGLFLGEPLVVGLALVGIVISNLLGLFTALFVTCVLRIPNDGSLTWDSCDQWTNGVGAEPLCLQCLRPAPPLVHYCPHCGQSVGQLTPYLPYEGIWFNAGMWAKLWDRLWYKEDDHVLWKYFYVLLIVIGAPILMLALPTVWWWKLKRTQEA